MLDKLEDYCQSKDFQNFIKLDYEYDLNNNKLRLEDINSSIKGTAFALWTMY